MAKVYVYPAIKLWPIVSYDRLRYSELTDYIFPHKSDIFIFDGGEGFSFYSFAEIVGGN